MSAPLPTAARTSAVAAALSGVLDMLDWRDHLRHEPGICDLVLGDPQEMPLPGFVSASGTTRSR